MKTSIFTECVSNISHCQGLPSGNIFGGMVTSTYVSYFVIRSYICSIVHFYPVHATIGIANVQIPESDLRLLSFILWSNKRVCAIDWFAVCGWERGQSECTIFV